MRKLGMLIVVLLLILSLCVHIAAEDLEEVIIRSCQKERAVHIGEYQISAEDFADLFYQLQNEGKIPWYIYRYSYSDYKGIVDTFTPRSLDPAVYDRVAYELAVAEVMFEAIHPGMTHTQMALAVHDYLITHCAYDESLEKNTGYDLLINGTTVCAGYAELYMDILQRLGIPCVCVVSEPMNHAWNLVYLEDSWYHVDVTWDDPVPDVQGQVVHTYFLLSDAQIRQGEYPHYDWETDIVCDSERYADAFWRDVYAPIWYVDAETCILRKDNIDYAGRIYSYKESTGKRTRLAANEGQSLNLGHGHYAYWHTGLSLWNGRLYFNDMDQVYSTDLQGKDRRVEYTHRAKQEKTFIEGSFVENDVLYLTLSDHDFEQVTVKEVALTPSDYHRHSYQTRQVEAGCETPEGTLHYCSCGVEMLQATGAAAGHQVTEFSVEGNSLLFGCQKCEQQYIIEMPDWIFLRWLTVFG